MIARYKLTITGSKTSLLTVEAGAQRLYDSFLEGLSDHTRRAYTRDLAIFADHLGAASPSAALDHLLRLPAGEANGVLLSYRSRMKDDGLTPATINRRLSSVRSAIKLGRTLGLTNWVPSINGLKAQSFRDTRGPGLDGTKAMLGHALSQSKAKAARDAAMIRLFFDLGLRCGEVVSLDIEHLDAQGRIWIKGKGRAQREARTLPEATTTALTTWLQIRPSLAAADELAFFVNLDRNKAHAGRRITRDGVYKVISGLGAAVGLKTRPHGLRHASVTAALDAGSDPRQVQQHARHSSLETTMRYDDNRKDFAGQVARSLAEVLDQP
jgi:integrase/recombinase XerC